MTDGGDISLKDLDDYIDSDSDDHGSNLDLNAAGYTEMSPHVDDLETETSATKVSASCSEDSAMLLSLTSDMNMDKSMSKIFTSDMEGTGEMSTNATDCTVDVSDRENSCDMPAVDNVSETDANKDEVKMQTINIDEAIETSSDLSDDELDLLVNSFSTNPINSNDIGGQDSSEATCDDGNKSIKEEHSSDNDDEITDQEIYRTTLIKPTHSLMDIADIDVSLSSVAVTSTSHSSVVSDSSKSQRSLTFTDDNPVKLEIGSNTGTYDVVNESSAESNRKYLSMSSFEDDETSGSSDNDFDILQSLEKEAKAVVKVTGSSKRSSVCNNLDEDEPTVKHQRLTVTISQSEEGTFKVRHCSATGKDSPTCISSEDEPWSGLSLSPDVDGATQQVAGKSTTSSPSTSGSGIGADFGDGLLSPKQEEDNKSKGMAKQERKPDSRSYNLMAENLQQLIKKRMKSVSVQNNQDKSKLDAQIQKHLDMKNTMIKQEVKPQTKPQPLQLQIRTQQPVIRQQHIITQQPMIRQQQCRLRLLQQQLRQKQSQIRQPHPQQQTEQPQATPHIKQHEWKNIQLQQIKLQQLRLKQQVLQIKQNLKKNQQQQRIKQLLHGQIKQSQQIKQQQQQQQSNAGVNIHNVTLEGGGTFEEDHVYAIKNKHGDVRKMVFRNGNLHNLDPNSHGKCNIGNATINIQNVLLEGGGSFQEGHIYLVRNKRGDVCKIIFKNGYFCKYDPNVSCKVNLSDREISMHTLALPGEGSFKDGQVYAIRNGHGEEHRIVFKNGTFHKYNPNYTETGNNIAPIGQERIPLKDVLIVAENKYIEGHLYKIQSKIGQKFIMVYKNGQFQNVINMRIYKPYSIVPPAPHDVFVDKGMQLEHGRYYSLKYPDGREQVMTYESGSFIMKFNSNRSTNVQPKQQSTTASGPRKTTSLASSGMGTTIYVSVKVDDWHLFETDMYTIRKTAFEGKMFAIFKNGKFHCRTPHIGNLFVDGKLEDNQLYKIDKRGGDQLLMVYQRGQLESIIPIRTYAGRVFSEEAPKPNEVIIQHGKNAIEGRYYSLLYTDGRIQIMKYEHAEFQIKFRVCNKTLATGDHKNMDTGNKSLDVDLVKQRIQQHQPLQQPQQQQQKHRPQKQQQTQQLQKQQKQQTQQPQKQQQTQQPEKELPPKQQPQKHQLEKQQQTPQIQKKKTQKQQQQQSQKPQTKALQQKDLLKKSTTPQKLVFLPGISKVVTDDEILCCVCKKIWEKFMAWKCPKCSVAVYCSLGCQQNDQSDSARRIHVCKSHNDAPGKSPAAVPKTAPSTEPDATESYINQVIEIFPDISRTYVQILFTQRKDHKQCTNQEALEYTVNSLFENKSYPKKADVDKNGTQSNENVSASSGYSVFNLKDPLTSQQSSSGTTRVDRIDLTNTKSDTPTDLRIKLEPGVASSSKNVIDVTSCSVSSSMADIVVEEIKHEVSSTSLMTCEACSNKVEYSEMVQCCSCHMQCNKCVKTSAKAVLLGDKVGQVSCSVKSCTRSVPTSELKKALNTFVLDLLEEKWLKDTEEALMNMDDVVKCPHCSVPVILANGRKHVKCFSCKKDYCRFCNCLWSSRPHDLCTRSSTKKTADGEITLQVPAYWEGMPENDEVYTLTPIAETSQEFQEISTLFYSSVGSSSPNAITLTGVQRIQNERLWEKYSLVRNHMIADLGEMHINERRLFHGTPKVDVMKSICAEGFDWRLCGKHGTAYGKGSYFAKNASYSHTYSIKSSPFGLPFSHPFSTPTLAVPSPFPSASSSATVGQSFQGFVLPPPPTTGPFSSGFNFPAMAASQPSYPAFGAPQPFPPPPTAHLATSRTSVMFIGRVLAGRMCHGSPDMRRPKKDESDPQGRPCHSAVNSVNSPSIFVIFDSNQCYPEYLIKYNYI